MSLRIVCGRAGTGKSRFCFHEIKEKIKQKENVYMITPEQFSFTAEQKLLDVCEGGSSLYAEVITFGRMANRVMEAVGRSQKKEITSQGKQMLLYSILSAEKKNLNFLGKSKENVELVERTITEFKKHNVSLGKLDEQIESTKSVYLKKKLEDIARIYHAYEEKIQDKYFDENDMLTLLADKLEQTDMFNGASIYIDEFSGFTTQEYEVIKILLRKAKQVTITICADGLNAVPEENIFYSNYITFTKLIKLAEQENIKIDENVKLKNAYRFKAEELQFLEQNLYTYSRQEV